MSTEASPDVAARMQVLEDRAAIKDLIIRYAHGVDGGDQKMVVDCFTDDAEASFAGVPAGVGGPAIAAFLAAMVPAGAQPTSTHLFTNVLVAVDGDAASVRSNAVVYGVRGEPQQLRLRGVSYRDRFVRTDAGWRIRERVHSVAWEGGAESLPITPIRPPA